MPQVGPDMPDELVNCVRRKLERDNYYIDKVTVYESDQGVDAFEFHVGDLYEMFGKPTEQSVSRVVSFSEDS